MEHVLNVDPVIWWIAAVMLVASAIGGLVKWLDGRTQRTARSEASDVVDELVPEMVEAKMATHCPAMHQEIRREASGSYSRLERKLEEGLAELGKGLRGVEVRVAELVGELRGAERISREKKAP